MVIFTFMHNTLPQTAVINGSMMKLLYVKLTRQIFGTVLKCTKNLSSSPSLFFFTNKFKFVCYIMLAYNGAYLLQVEKHIFARNS